MNKVENHPIENGFIPKNAEKLIVGTFPPKSIYFGNPDFFFYASAKNHLWNRMENIFPNVRLKKTKTKCANISEAQNRKDKENFCTENRIGFLDIFTKISRKADSSNDSDLISVEDILDNKKFFQILDENPELKRICCTYDLAYNQFKSKLDKNNFKIVDDKETANGEKILYNHNGKSVEIVLLYPATRSRQKRELKDSQYKKYLFEN